MKALDFPLLADENIHPDVITFLRTAKLDIQSVAERGKFGISDKEVLLEAIKEKRVVLTHDSDFGGLALQGEQLIGIIYIRPGHIKSEFTIKTIETLREKSPEVTPPFILVAERTGDTVKIRVKHL